ncbi:MAG: polyphosphate polymerase domain-containing protein [Acidimicrobiales bacterium]|nr:polyphosphate polymerase domain-containing protein [Acidimicrobiales bacterium]MCB9395151.1 polyphosphate polymerase domain-containing protein [Acidimicrobiaceae bacterium]
MTGTGPLAPIGLDELDATASLLDRVDRKYVVDEELLDALERRPPTALRELEIDGRRDFGYSSVYFDTDDRHLHRLAATGRRRRFKVRTRTYVDSGRCVLELKWKTGRGVTIKERHDHVAADDEIGAEAHRIVVDALRDRVRVDPAVVERLVPTLRTEYRRRTWLDTSGGSRITCDTDLVCTIPDGSSLRLDGVVIETKSSGAAGALDRWLWRQGQRPLTFSKYCTALSLIEPTLPANKWHRTVADLHDRLDVRSAA